MSAAAAHSSSAGRRVSCFPFELGLWENGPMKTTLEIPDELARRIRMRAAQRDQKLKDTIAQLLEIGLAHAPQAEPASTAPKPVRLRGRGPVSIDDIEAAIAAGRD
jgi:hypothetical protein